MKTSLFDLSRERRAIVVLVAIASASTLQGCSPQQDVYPRSMWDGQRYDVAVPVAKLRALGWECQSERFESDPYDGACGVRVDFSNGPEFSVFGVPRTASTVFLKDGALKGINIGVHATSVPVLAVHLNHEFGKPLWYEAPQGCTLVWRRADTHYTLNVSNEISDGYASLYVEIGGKQPSGTQPSALARLAAWIQSTTCSRVT